MNNVTIQLVYLGAYLGLYFAGITWLWLWQIKRRGGRPPIAFKLRRGPGEALRRRMAKSGEEMIFIVGGAALAPVFAGLVLLQLLAWINPRLSLAAGMALVAGPTVIVLFIAGRYLKRRLARYRDDRLHYLGERAIGEAIEPLIAEGYQVFHDIPAVAGVMKFNLDHLAVGPNGIFVIETETRRNGRARSGLENHTVTYDGRQLSWPWADDSQGLKNAQDRAWWLNDWLTLKAGLNVVAQPVLALPGWEVVAKGTGPVLVVNQRQLAGALHNRGSRILTAQQIDLITRQLDQLCRDVED